MLDIILFPSVFVIKLFLYLLERLYKTCLQFKATSKYSFVQYLWSLALKVFLSTVMHGYCLLLYYSILSNIITTNQSLVVGNSVPFNFFNLAATILRGESRGAPLLFLDRTETHRVEKNVFGDAPSPLPPYLKCWIHHCF